MWHGDMSGIVMNDSDISLLWIERIIAVTERLRKVTEHLAKEDQSCLLSEAIVSDFLELVTIDRKDHHVR
jgi:DNA-binding SARP family transcriptional activator